MISGSLAQTGQQTHGDDNQWPEAAEHQPSQSFHQVGRPESGEYHGRFLVDFDT